MEVRPLGGKKGKLLFSSTIIEKKTIGKRKRECRKQGGGKKTAGQVKRGF